MSARLEAAAAALLDWATRSAFPLWAGAGFDHERCRFEERLTLQGEPVPDAPIRLMSQARQIHSYALAARNGWYPSALEFVEKAHASMMRDFYRRDDQQGWVFSIRRDGSVNDARRDLYAHAFVLLALASHAAATGQDESLAVADETLAFVDSFMRAPEGGGFVEQLPVTGGVRRQNPHMHLFEALLALWECSGKAQYSTLASEVFDLFATRFFRPDAGVLGEYFTTSLAPAEGLSGRRIEPGHHYEWIYLLRWYERLSGHSVQRFVDPLYHHADTFGYDGHGLIVDELLIDGRHHVPSHRAWPVTEAIRANILEAACGRPGAADKAAILTEALLNRFLVSRPAGGWMDRLDETGRAVGGFMPASTLYHVVGALTALCSRTTSPS
ncbi:MAG: mannose-6-phosphate isomerase [Alphaproteobacteria bacterium]|nr:mannose-6-phosphate isomerase [Alphaproteobacteria bacterium]